jgi:glycosyltransferase involved in cell wall biosynthesis
MKIGFFCTFYPEKDPFTQTRGFGHGGADESLHDIITELHHSGHEITIFSIGIGHHLQHEKPSSTLELFRFPVSRLGGLTHSPSIKGFLSWRFLGVKNNLHFDVLHAKLGNPPGGLAALLYKKRFHLPLVLDIGGKQNPEWGNPLRVFLMKIYVKQIFSKVVEAADIILVRSKEYLADDPMLKDYEDKIRIVPNGVDFSFYSSDDDAPVPSLGSINDLKQKKKIVLFAGNLVESKGVHILIQALEKLRLKHPEVILVIAGRGIMQTALEELVRQLRMEDAVYFVGYVDKSSLKRLYHLADLFVLPSMSEGFPRVLLEAMAAETPCLVSDIGANRGALNDGEVGFIARCFDVDDFAEKMDDFFSHDEVWRKQEGSQARRYAAMFSWDKTAKQIERIYEELLHNH